MPRWAEAELRRMYDEKPMKTIPEKDWKLLRSMQEDKLALLCDKILAQAEDIAKNRKDKEHESFLRLWDEMHDANTDIERLFGDMRRSNAIFILIGWKNHGLLSDAELLSFSDETQTTLARF